MRTYFLIVALALFKVSMSRPNVANNNDDFSINMYEGNNHLRYQRSNDATSSVGGTTVTIENVDADHGVMSETQNLKENLSVEESMKLAQDVITNWEAKTSEGQHMEVEAHNVVEDNSNVVKKVEPVAVATKKESEVKEVKEAVKEEVKTKEKAVEKATTEEAKSFSKSTSKTEISTGSSGKNEETVELSKPRYLFQYGEVLNLINKDKVSPLASKSRSSKSDSSRKLSKGSQGGSVSYTFVNGQEVKGPSSYIMSKPSSSYGAPTGVPSPVAYGPGGAGYGFNQVYGVPPGSMYGAIHDQTHNLKSNMKMGFQPYRSFSGHIDNRGIHMLNSRQPVPFQGVRFRPF